MPQVGFAGSAGRQYAATFMDQNGQHAVAVVDEHGAAGRVVALPGRGHSMAARPGSADIVAFARRPGRFAVVLDRGLGEVVAHIESAPGRHFYGHGVFSADGRWLFTTENDYDNGRGVVGVYDAADGYSRREAFFSGGIGPHDIQLLDDGQTLVLANGGIATHPESGRAKLNLATMAPSLAYIDAASGKQQERRTLSDELHQLSIRHLALRGTNVALAMQYQGPRTDVVPLVGLHRRGEPLRVGKTPRQVARRMRNYCGGAAIDRDNRVLAATCPRGGLTVFWAVPSLEYVGHWDIADASGIAAGDSAGSFVITSGNGAFATVDVRQGRVSLHAETQSAWRWDNHLVGF